MIDCFALWWMGYNYGMEWEWECYLQCDDEGDQDIWDERVERGYQICMCMMRWDYWVKWDLYKVMDIGAVDQQSWGADIVDCESEVWGFSVDL